MISRKLLTMVAAAGIATLISTNANAAAQTKRLWGNDRYETGSAIVEQGWQSSSYYAVIVNGENFPDALSAAPLAQKYNAPILLTQSNSLDSNTAAELKRLSVKNVFIVGGEGVVTPSVEKAINDLGIQTTRYKGQDRDETAVKVASQIGTKNGVIVAIDDDYTDALSAAPIAANLQMPIILVSKNGITSSLKSYIFANNIPTTYVLGDSNIISDGVANMFPNVQRITGKDKYERNINIIKTFQDKLDFSNVCLAYSEKFADALSGSVLASAKGNPIVLVGDEVSDSTSNFIKDKSSSISNFTVLGGTAGINNSVVSQLASGGTDSSGDTDSDAIENAGNTSGNLRNGGFVVEKNGWIYYIKNGNKICKIRTDGTEETKLADVKDARSLNVIDNSLYYVASTDQSTDVHSNKDSIAIYKEGISGGYSTSLISEDEDNYGKGYPYMKVVDHWVCYSPQFHYISKENANFYDTFYRLDSDTRDANKSSGEYFKSMFVEGGFVYYTTLGDNRIRQMPTSGNKKDDGTTDNSKEKDLGIKGVIRDVVNGYIYYDDVDGDTYKIKVDGTEKTKITSLPDKFIIYGDWIYYVVQGNDNLYQLRKMKIDGTQDTGFNAYKVDNFSITGDWVYYRNSGSGNVYRTRLDGSSQEEFPDKIAIKTIKDINVNIKKGNVYSFPQAVPATMEDGSTQYSGVTWDKTNLDTSKAGNYDIYGTVEGYTNKVKLTVVVSDN